jgi:hypothetical protein
MNQKGIELKTKINEFEKDLKSKETNERGWTQYSKFLKLYPFKEHPKYIDNLTPEKIYNPRGEYFFNWIEHKLKPLGHLAIGSARVWESAKNNTDKLKELLKIAVDNSLSVSEKIDAHWEDIKGFGGDRHIVKKIIFCYYPEKIIPTFKTDQLEYFVEKLGLEYRLRAYEKYGKDYDVLSVGQKFELLNGLLLDFKNQDDELKKWDNALFSRFLHIAFPDFPSVEGFGLNRHIIKPTSPIGLIAEPTYEQEVVFLFSKFHHKLGFPIIIKIGAAFPDAEVMNEKKELKKIEFEVRASDFINHCHPSKGCDYIVCWENDLTEEQIKQKGLQGIISLKEELEK